MNCETPTLPQYLDGIAGAIVAPKYRFSDEAGLQRQVEAVLEELAPGVFKREWTLRLSTGRRDRPDFFCSMFGIAIEIKTSYTGGSPSQVVRQLMRYVEHESVRGVIVVSSSHRILAALPTSLGDKPIQQASIIASMLTA